MVAVYLDTCCLNRFFDDQSQQRVRDEAQAVRWILAKIDRCGWSWIGSELLMKEISSTQNIRQRYTLRFLSAGVDILAPITEVEENRARNWLRLGKHTAMADMLHLACAMSGGAEVFLTTDDRLIRRSALLGDLSLRVTNPLRWMREFVP